MKQTTQKAIESFRAEQNCAQSVLTSYSDKLGFDQELALNITSGFGAGMGRLQKTCGAVTGAFMVMGVYNEKYISNSDESKEATNTMIQKFSNNFIAIHQTTDCAELLNCDLKTEKGQQHFHDNNLLKKVCEKCISSSIQIINDLIKL